jgi:hypothetical protein
MLVVCDVGHGSCVGVEVRGEQVWAAADGDRCADGVSGVQIESM